MQTKRNRKYWVVGALVAAVGLSLAVASQARPQRGGAADGPRAQMGGQGFAKALGLSDAQTAQLKEMREKSRDAAILRRGQMQNLEAQLRVQWLQKDLDKGKIRSLAKQIQDLRDQGAQARVESRLATLDVLTADQRAKLGDLRAAGRRHAAMMRHGGGRGNRMGWGHPGMGRGGRGGARGMRGPGMGMGRGMGGGMMSPGQSNPDSGSGN